MNQRRKFGVARKLGVLGVAAGSATLLAGCDVNPPENGFFKLLRFGWPEGVTPESQATGNFWVWTWVAAWIIGIIVWGLTLYSMTNFTAKKAKKQGKGEFPRQTAYNVPVELVLTLIPVLIVMTLFFFTVQAQDKVTALDKDPEVTIDVTAFQWNWKFGYGNISADLMKGQEYNGRVDKPAEEQFFTEGGHHAPSAEDRAAQKEHPIHGYSKQSMSYLHFDEIETLGTTEEVPVLVVPEDTAIQFDLASADVVHSFWVPEFLFKRDAFPNPEANKSNRVFQIEKVDSEKVANRPEDNPSDKVKNAFVGRCAEMCGTYHAMMNFEIRAVSRENFTEYIRFRQQHPDATNADALAHIGEPAFAVSTSPFNSGRTDTRELGDHSSNTVDLNATAK